MGLLFAGGVMNLLQIAAIAVFILLREKTMPSGAVGAPLVGAARIFVGLLSLTGMVALG